MNFRLLIIFSEEYNIGDMVFFWISCDKDQKVLTKFNMIVLHKHLYDLFGLKSVMGNQ